MSALHRVVTTDPDSAGWLVLDGDDQQVVVRTRTRQEAVEAATEELKRQPAGGRLQVRDADGRVEIDQAIASPGAPSLAETGRVIAREGKHVDKGLDALDWVAGFLGIVGAPFGALMNPELQDAAGSGWIALTFATFTWTVGCALAVVVISKSGLGGFPLVGAVSVCFAAALLIAWVIGQGVLDISAPQTGLGAFNFIATIIVSAYAAYGPVGLLLCGGIGAWLGVRVSAHVEDGFLA